MTRTGTLHRSVAAGVLGIAVYFLLPQGVQNLALLASNLVAMTAILVVVRRRGLAPRAGWLLLAAFPAATGVGNAVYFVNDTVLDVEPFPSYGDAGFLGGYLLLAAGLLRLQRARTGARDLPAVLDTAIVTVGFAAASWVLFVAPLLRDPTFGLLQRLTALGYPVADVLVLAVAARFFLSSRRRSGAFSWLAASVVVMLVADTAFAVLNLMGAYSTGHPVDALILSYNLLWATVAMHPDAGDLSRPVREVVARPSWWRLAALTAASLVAPGVLVAQVVLGQYRDALVTAGASMVLFLLVVGRMVGLVRELEAVLAQRHALEGELAHRAHHDDLTGLVNRRLFAERVQRALEDRPGGGVGVLYLDLDRFKTINDSLGHAAGDTLLVATADRLRAAVQADDTVARLGGDEFAVLLGDDRPLEAARSAVRALLSDPVVLHGLDLRVAASVGTAQSLPGDSVEDLLHRADTAMYAEKTRHDRRARATTSGAHQPATAPSGRPAR